MAIRNFLRKFSNTADKIGNTLGNVVGGAVNRVADRVQQEPLASTKRSTSVLKPTPVNAQTTTSPTNTSLGNTTINNPQFFTPSVNTSTQSFGPVAPSVPATPAPVVSNANPTPTPKPTADANTEAVDFNAVEKATDPQLPADPQTSDMVDAQIQATLAGGTPVTQEEKQVDALSEQILGLQAGLLGQEEFIQQQEAFKQQQEITRQINEINGLIGQKQAQLGAFENAREKEGGLGTFIRSDINDARRQAAIEIQGLQAAANVAQGNFMIAEEQLQNAIDLKYGPIKEQIGYLQEVLNVRAGQADRAIARQDTDRQNRLAALTRRFDALQQDEEEAKALLMQAGQNGASASTIAKAIQDLDKGLISPADVWEQFGTQALTVPTATQLAGNLTSAINSGQVQLTKDQQTTAFKMIDDYEAQLKDFGVADITSSFNKVASSAQNVSPAGDLALVFNFMKMLDPGSVVREAEFQSAADATAYLQRVNDEGINLPAPIAKALRKLSKGTILNADQRADFLNQATNIYQGAQQQKASIDEQFAQRAWMFNVPPEVILRDMSTAVSQAGRSTVQDTISNVSNQDLIQGINSLEIAGQSNADFFNNIQ